MSISVNKTILVGRVGADPETRGRDGSIVTMSVATSESWKDKSSGEKQERTTWHKVVIFNEPTAKFVKGYVKKGDLVYVEGQYESRKWKPDGEDKEITIFECVVRPFTGSVQLQSKDRDSGSDSRESSRSGRDEAGSSGWSRDANRSAGSFGGGSGGGSRDLDDEIPF